MDKVKKDNLTDLIGDVTKPQESTPPEPDANPKPQLGLDDYQVTTPDGEVIDLALLTVDKSQNINQTLMRGTDQKGNHYILIVQRKTP